MIMADTMTSWLGEFVASLAGGPKASETGLGREDAPESANQPVGLESLDPMDPEPDLERIDRAFQRAQKFKSRSRIMEQNELCRRFWDGEHWYFWDAQTRSIKEDAELRNHGLVYNVFRSDLHLLLAKSTGRSLRLEATPSGRKSLSGDVARASTQCLDYFHDALEFDELDRVIHLWKMLFNKTYAHVFWNAEKTALVPYPVPQKGMAPVFGDVDVEPVLASAIYVEPGVTRLQDARRFFTARLRSIEWVRQTYGDDVADRVQAEEVHDTAVVGEDAEVRRVATIGATTGDEKDAIDGRSYSEEAGMVWVKECWERTSGRWRRVCYLYSKANQTWLNPGESTYATHGYVEYCFLPSPDQFWPPSLAFQGLRIQRAINKTLYAALSNVMFSGKPILVTTDTNSLTDNNLYYTLNLEAPPPNGFEPKWNLIPQTAGASMDVANRLIDMLHALFIIYDVSRGEVSGNQSGRAISSLISEQQVTPDEISRETIRSNGRRAEALMQIVRDYYVEPRLIHLYDGKYEPRLLTGDALPAVARWRPVVASFLPRDPGSKIQMVQAMTQLGIYEPGPVAEMRARKIRQDLEADGLASTGDVSVSLDREVAATKRIIDAIEEGPARVRLVPTPQGGVPLVVVDGEPAVNEYQDHVSRLAEYARFLTEDRYLEEWGDKPQSKFALSLVMESHKQQIQAAQQQQMAQAAQMNQQAQRQEAEKEVLVDQAKTATALEADRARKALSLQDDATRTVMGLAGGRGGAQGAQKGGTGR